jgi:tetratricopeptide (TPR) repeat protein
MPRQKSTHVDNPEAVGLRLREARERCGISQRELAFPGCSPAYISRIENGDRIPSLQLLREIGRRLGVSADYLATGTDQGGELDPVIDAELALRLDDTEVAEHLFTEALAKPLDAVQRGRALGGLGQLAFRSGDLELAIEHLGAAESLLGDAVPDHPAITEALGKAYAIRGEHESAIGVFERALERVGDSGLNGQRFAVLLANALIDAGRFGRAEELLGRAISDGDGQDPIVLARLYWSQSRLHAMRGAYDVAARYARRALAAIELTENAQYAARAHHLLAYIELQRGRPEEALDLLRRGLPLVRLGGERFELSLFRLEEARALVSLGRAPEARELALEVAATLDGMSRVDAARAIGVVAEVLADAGDRERAIELYRTSVEEMGDSPLAFDSRRKLAELLEAEGRRDEAFEVLKQAVATKVNA